MKVYAFTFNGAGSPTISMYVTRKDAEQAGNEKTLVANAEELFAAKSITSAMMVALYNAFSEKNPIKAFNDRTTACERLIALAEAKATMVVVAPKQEEKTMAKATKEKTARAPRVKKEAEASARGRASQFAGLTIKPSPEYAEENPKREGSIAADSFQLVWDNPKGITYEDYLSAGGLAKHIRRGVAHGFMVVE